MSERIGPDYFFHLKMVSDPDLTADGSRLAFILSRIDPQEMQTRSQIMVIDLPDGRPRAFTQEANADTPRWSPNGSTLAFLRADAKGHKQLWTISSQGGEARQRTDLRGAVWEYSWAPDSSRIVVLSDVDPDRPPENHDPKIDPRPLVARRLRYREDGVGWRGAARRHLFVLDLSRDGVTQITAGDWDDRTPVWSQDATRIAFLSARSDEQEATARSEAYVVDVRGGTPQYWSAGLYAVGGVGWSPDGSRLVVIGAERPEATGGYGLQCQGWLYILEPERQPCCLTDDSVRPVVSISPTIANQRLDWTDKGEVLFLADARGQSFLCTVPAAGRPLRKITAGSTQITRWTFDAMGRKAVIVSVPPTSAGDLYLVDLASGRETRLTDYNDDYFAAHPVARLEKFSIARDGCELECRLWLPPRFDPTNKYPLLVDIHGGPHSVFYDTFYPLHQVPASAGYVVLAVNPRGSCTYGLEFATRVHGDWGRGDYLDIMAGIEEVVRRPYIDPERLVIHGSSYGGYLTGWTLSQTDRFKAAVIAAPVLNLWSFYGTSDIGVTFSEVQYGGKPREALDWYLERSPLTHAHQVTTPVLLMHGEEDLRCLIEQSEQYFVALKRAGKDVELVRFPGCPHGLFIAPHPKLRREYYVRMLEWFDRHLTRCCPEMSHKAEQKN